MNPFQTWYRETMARHGWSLNQIARLLGIAPASASGHYHGRALPGPALQRKLAEITGEPLECIKALVWDSEEMRAASRRPPARGGTEAEPATPDHARHASDSGRGDASWPAR